MTHRDATPVTQKTPLHRLRHVRWIGGGSGAGKSTIARRLAAAYGWGQYSTDEALSVHRQRSTPETDPLLHEFLEMDMDQRWVDRSPEVMLHTFHGFTGEGFRHIVADLLTLPTDRPIVAEGFRLLPRLVAPLLADRRHAVWLAPTPAFRRAAFEARGFTWEIPSRTSDPERALANLLRRDELFTTELVREARSLGLQVIQVDVGITVDQLTAQVAAALGVGAGERVLRAHEPPYDAH